MIEREIACRAVLADSGWCGPSRILVDQRGFIAGIVAGTGEPPRERYGVVVPGMPNLHSHAFQRQMAGLTESSRGSADSFWSWRTAMYRLAQRFTPEQLQAVAAWVQLEMLQAGFTSCAEFHYLHHQEDGRPYDNPAEMSARLVAAAAESGMALTLLPVLYCRAGFDHEDVLPVQRRFRSSPDGFLRLLEACRELISGHELHRLGIAPHSLRAVSPAQLETVLAAVNGHTWPVHVHVAEQMREVEECKLALGTSPVNWLLDHHPVGENWCLVHATHIDDEELNAAAASGAVAGLCPTTEAELGDGCFRAEAWSAAGGRLGIGTDSNLRVSVAEELRLLEFQCRLRLTRRNVLAREDRSCGRSLFEAAAAGGAQALQQPAGTLRAGLRADLVELDDTHPLLEGRQGDEWLDTWLFAGDASMIRSVWVAGRKVVADGRHLRFEHILDRYREAAGELRA